MKICKKCFITGKVQGVFYRASTLEKANQFGVTGWVKNCVDGSVEVLVCGEEKKVNLLCGWLWQGPTHASVTKVDCQEETYMAITHFSVVH